MHSTATVSAWLERILGHEGGYSRDPDDTGNWTGGARGLGELKGTRWGISAAAYPHLDIANLSADEASALYLEDYLAPMRADRFEDGVAYQLFDFAVNSGVHAACRALQRAVGVADDGIIGPVTLAAVARFSEATLIMRVIAERLDYMTNARTWEVHGRGWVRRVAGQLRYGGRDAA